MKFERVGTWDMAERKVCADDWRAVVKSRRTEKYIMAGKV